MRKTNILMSLLLPKNLIKDIDYNLQSEETRSKFIREAIRARLKRRKR